VRRGRKKKKEEEETGRRNFIYEIKMGEQAAVLTNDAEAGVQEVAEGSGMKRKGVGGVFHQMEQGRNREKLTAYI